MTKEGKKGALKAQQPEQGLKIAMPQGQDAPLSMDVPREGQDAPLSSDVPQEPCQDASLKKAPAPPKAPKEIQPTKQGLRIATPLKIAMPEGQGAPLSADVPQEQGQGATLKGAPKAPKYSNLVKGSGVLKAQKSVHSKEMSSTAGTRPGAPKAPKAPKEDQQTKHVELCSGLSVSARDMIVLEGSSPLKVQKSGQAKKLSGTAHSEPPKTQVNKRKAKADVKEKEGTVVPKQQNVKRLKRMKEVEVCEAIERKLVVDEVKVKGHTGKGQLEKVPEVKIALKRDGVKNKAKKHVEKGQEDEGPANKALALVGFSKRPKLQVKRAKQSEESCTTSTTVGRGNEKEIKSHVEEGYKSRCRIKVGTLIVHSDEDKSSGGSSGGSDDDGDEDDESNQDGSGDDDLDYGSDGDANDDDVGVT
ncbi:hypothetical protein L7F22_049938 [Adiantum nelumboides]|nr:hypothetical protein [Adiantum nelumboides]